MILKQVFKTYEGALKRARFEAAHCNGVFIYFVVRMEDRTYRIERKRSGKLD